MLLLYLSARTIRHAMQFSICSTNDWAPVAHLTPFGWTVIGPPSGKENNNQVNQISVGNGLQLGHLLQQFFSGDAFGVKPDVKQPTSPDERRAVDSSAKPVYSTVKGTKLPFYGKIYPRYQTTSRWFRDDSRHWSQDSLGNQRSEKGTQR